MDGGNDKLVPKVGMNNLVHYAAGSESKADTKYKVYFFKVSRQNLHNSHPAPCLSFPLNKRTNNPACFLVGYRIILVSISSTPIPELGRLPRLGLRIAYIKSRAHR